MATTCEIALKEPESQQDEAASIGVENVRKSFGSHMVLNGVSLSVRRGETLAVLGRSGTAKAYC